MTARTQPWAHSAHTNERSLVLRPRRRTSVLSPPRARRASEAAALILALLPCTALASPPWEVQPLPPIEEQQVLFSNGIVRLVGTLYLPANGTALPAVVVEHAAEAPTRDYALYRHLALGLPPIGIAVLVYDRRGSGASSGNRNEASYEQLADDAIAGEREIAKNPRIDPRKIGFWGLSQGGWLAVLAANRSGNAAFAVSVSAPLVTPEVQMKYSVRNLLITHGYESAAQAAALEARAAHDAFTLGKLSRADTLQALAKVKGEPWASLTFLPAPEDLTRDPANSRWHKEMLFDPLLQARAAHLPVLFMYGGADPWVPVRESIERLQTLLPDHPRFQYFVIDGANHTMTRVSKEDMAFDAVSLKAAAPDAPEYFTVLADWLSRHTR